MIREREREKEISSYTLFKYLVDPAPHIWPMIYDGHLKLKILTSEF